MGNNKRLVPISHSSIKTKNIFGFDIETYSKDNSFYMGSLYSLDLNEPYIFVFYDKADFLNEIKKNKFRDCFICATNLAFDYMGIFFNNIEVNEFKLCFRGSMMIGANTYVFGEKNEKFFSPNSYYIDSEGKKHISKHRVRFIDSLNYAFYSVASMGKIIKCPKLPTPKCIINDGLNFARKPKNQEEEEELRVYNIRDSQITYKFMKFLFNSFEKLDIVPKLTIASTALYCFRRNFLKNAYDIHDKEVLLKLFEAYYGGRTECFQIGKFTNYNYFDFNSLYPSVMAENSYPDPNTLRQASYFEVEDFIKQILFKYEGVSCVEVTAPSHLYYPLLPVRTKENLLFPIGTFKGYYSHIELKRAVELGYTINKHYKSIFYTGVCEPFKDFVNFMYNERMKYKNINDPIQLIFKLILNSLYGKFCQKFENTVIQPFNLSIKELRKIKEFERLNDFIIYKESTEPSSFNVVIWGVYVSAYARLKLYNEFERLKPIYCDTDSIITREKIKHNKLLGGLDLEYKIVRGCLIRPKFYAFQYEENGKIHDEVKIKGISEILKYDEFYDRLINHKINDDNEHYMEFNYQKFCKFKESLRRGLLPNQIIPINKKLLLKDKKRVFINSKIRFDRLNQTKPINMDDL